MPTFEQSKELIKEKIHWFRKGTKDLPKPIPNYIHSWKVYEALKTYGFDQDIQMAWLLHDIIEDGWMTLNELRELWYSDDILHLVDLATHDMTIDGSFEKRKKMLQRLIEEDNKDARAIKLADISDNLLECHLMPSKEKLERFLNKKCPVFVYYGNKYFGGTEFYNEFLERYFKQVKAYNEYFI